MPENPELIETTYYLNDVADPLTQVLMTYDDNDNYKAAYAYGLERFEVQALDNTRPESQDPLYYLYDGLGSVSQLTRPNGEVRDHYRYDEFGVPSPGAKLSEDGRNVNHNSFGYTGELWDEEDDLLYLRSRYYQPEVGRFATRDGFPGFAVNPLSLNKYGYVENSPVNYVDPLGFNKKDSLEEERQINEPKARVLSVTAPKTSEQILQEHVDDFIKNAYWGDVILTNGGFYVLDPMIRKATNSKYSHAAIYVGGGEIAHMQAGGWVKVSVYDFFKQYNDIDIFRMKELPNFKTRQLIVDWATAKPQQSLGFDYSNLVLESNPAGKAAICSEFVWRAYNSEAVKIEIAKHTQYTKVIVDEYQQDKEVIVERVSPQDLANSDKLKKIGSWKGLKGIPGDPDDIRVTI